MNEQGSVKNGSAKVFKGLIQKLLPWAVIGIIGFGIEIVTWRVEVNERLKIIPSVEWKTKIDAQLERKDEQIEELKATIKEMKLRMDTAMSTGAAGHMTHREFNIAKQNARNND